MSNRVLFQISIIDGMNDSGLKIDKADTILDISFSYIFRCTATNGAGIYANCTLNMNKVCFGFCHATLLASSFVSYGTTSVEATSIFKCSPNDPGNDDNVNLHGSISSLHEVNFSDNVDTGSSSYQMLRVATVSLAYLIHANGYHNPNDIGSSKIMECITIASNIVIEDSIYLNNSATSVFTFNGVTSPFSLVRCCFSENKISRIFYLIGGTLPSLAFQEVIILDNTPIGTGVVSYDTYGSVPSIKAGFQTKECVGYHRVEIQSVRELRLDNDNFALVLSLSLISLFVSPKLLFKK